MGLLRTIGRFAEAKHLKATYQPIIDAVNAVDANNIAAKFGKMGFSGGPMDVVACINGTAINPIVIRKVGDDWQFFGVDVHQGEPHLIATAHSPLEAQETAVTIVNRAQTTGYFFEPGSGHERRF